MTRKKPPTPLQSLRAQAEARAEVAAAERRQLDVERMSSYSDDAFECESPHAMLASSRGLRPEQRSDVVYEQHTQEDATQSKRASPYLVVDNIGRLRVDSVSDSNHHDDVAYGELAQPRPEIILRWKRFALLVLLTAAVMTAIAAWLRQGFVVYHDVDASIADDKADTVNSYIGLIMGFIESIVGLGVEEIFPVFIVYLHNLRWYPGDDPATKKQSKFKKFALTIFIPAVMMAVGSSLSAVQANQQDDNSNNTVSNNTNSTISVRHLMQDVTELEVGGLENSILKTAQTRKVTPMSLLDTSVCTNQEADVFSTEALLAAAPKAVFGFPLQEWGTELGNAWYREESGGEQLSAAMSVDTAYDLWLQGRAHLLKCLRTTQKGQLSAAPSSIDGLLDDVLVTLNATGLPLTSSAAVEAQFKTLAINSLMNLNVMTLQVPLRVADNASVVCGDSSCALLEPVVTSGGRLPRKQIAMSSFGRNCTSTDSGASNCEVVSNSAFLYGLTTMTTATSDGSNAVRRSLVLSFARLSWRFDGTAYRCARDKSPHETCLALHHQLDDDRYLVTLKNWLPQLPTKGLSTPISLVQLMESKFRVTDQTSRFATLDRFQSWPAPGASCSPAIDTYLQFVNSNHFYLTSDLVDTMAISAVLYIFQNARVVDSAPGDAIMMTQRRLADTGRKVRVFLSNTAVGNACTWTGCGVLLILTILVLALPNERARLSPPRGGNARAERFVAVQTEQIYPNLIYKKRFLIGKTGEEIKFGEFAVESVGLHHKMEEDEQIYI